MKKFDASFRHAVFFLSLSALTIGMIGSFACRSDKRATMNPESPDQVSNIAIDPESGLLASFERIFHATSSSRKGGIHFTSGYSHYRISIVNLENGTLQNRLVAGDDKHKIEFLGLVGHDLWCYGYDGAVGLHARNIGDLQISHAESEILARNPALNQGLVKGMASVSSYFRMDGASKNIIATTVDGRVFMIDPHTLAARAVDSTPERPMGSLGLLDHYAQFRDGRRLNLAGEPRQRIVDNSPGKVQAENPKAEITPTFLNANFIHDTAIQPERGSYPSVLQDHDHIFLLQDSKIGPDAKAIITCVDSAHDWAVVWQSELPGIGAAKARDRAVLLAVQVWRSSLIVVVFPRIHSFDLNTGKLQWDYKF